jgi:hypothetical protein
MRISQVTCCMSDNRDLGPGIQVLEGSDDGFVETAWLFLNIIERRLSPAFWLIPRIPRLRHQVPML